MQILIKLFQDYSSERKAKVMDKDEQLMMMKMDAIKFSIMITNLSLNRTKLGRGKEVRQKSRKRFINE